MDRKLGAVSPFLGGGAGSPSSSLAWAEACLHAKCHLDLSSPLAKIHQSHRQSGQDRQADRTTVREHMANRFTNCRPKINRLQNFCSIAVNM